MSLEQQRHLPVTHGSIIRTGEIVSSRSIREVGGIERTIFGQRLQTDEKWLAGESGKTLIGRIAEAHGTEGQNLPDALPGGGQLIRETDCFRTEIAYPKARRQRGWMQQNAGAASQLHGLTLAEAPRNAGLLPPAGKGAF